MKKVLALQLKMSVTIFFLKITISKLVLFFTVLYELTYNCTVFNDDVHGIHTCPPTPLEENMKKEIFTYKMMIML